MQPGRLARCPASLPSSAELADFELTFLDLLHEFDATDQHCGGSKAFQTQHRAQSLFDSPMVLFDHVVQIFVAPNSYSLRQLAGLL